MSDGASGYIDRSASGIDRFHDQTPLARGTEASVVLRILMNSKSSLIESIIGIETRCSLNDGSGLARGFQATGGTR